MRKYHEGVYVCFKHDGYYTTNALDFTSHMMLRHWPWDTWQNKWHKAPIEQLNNIRKANDAK